VQLEWSAIDNATSYRVNRREASLNDVLGPLCSYPVYGVEFEVLSNKFSDTTAVDDITYCYSVVALNDKLLGETYSPESFVRTGYRGNDDSISLPYIDDISLDIDTEELQKTLTLPGTFDYQLSVVEHSLDIAPDVQLTVVAAGEYLLELSDIVLANQTVTIGLTATHKTTGLVVAQLFNVFSSNIENQRPAISLESNIKLEQQSSNEFVINVTDDQAIAVDGIYAYSRDEDLLSRVWVSEDDNGQYILNVIHEGLKTGDVEVVVGYSDGEYLTEAVTTIDVARTIFNPTQTQDVTWYVNAGESITRLLPFYDIDEGEALTVTIVNEPSQGALKWPLFDKVTYTANDNFIQDSFSFYVSGEDGITTEEVFVSIQSPQQIILTPKQKIITKNDGAFLSHTGSLYLWGWWLNYGTIEGLEVTIGDLKYTPYPTKISGNDWVNVAFDNNQAFFLKNDGTLWSIGYSFGSNSRVQELTQVGASADWVSTSSDNGNGIFLFTKNDGSVWGIGNNSDNVISQRAELDGWITEISQIIPIYDAKQAKHTGSAGFALTNENTIYSWAGGYISSGLEREINLGYLAPITQFAQSIDKLEHTTFHSFALSENKLFAWGKGSEQLFFNITNKLSEPTQINSENWLTFALGNVHIAAIKHDHTLWTWGGSQFFLDGSPSINAHLGRGEYADTNLAQVDDDNTWLEVWTTSTSKFTYALDMTGQIWVAGGVESQSFPLHGADSSEEELVTFTKLTSIPLEEAGTGDFDSDGLRDYNDPDDDDDGVLDQYDAFRTDASETLDTDLDGIGNNADTDDDDDGDSVNDDNDAFPLDAAESVDTDSDGMGNNADADDDNDGVDDNNDAYPLDATRSAIPVTPAPPNNGNSDSSGGGSTAYLLIIILLGCVRLFGNTKQ
jgi:alpha-tubulin suppressor-like RCC1 family protein